MNKRVLVISPVPTHPADSGNRVRVAAILENLENLGHCVHLAHIQQDQGDEAAMKSRWGDRYHPVPYHRPVPSIVRKIYRKIAAFFSPNVKYVKSIDEWYDPGVDRFIGELNSKYKFNVVIVEYVFFSRVLNLFGEEIVKVIDTHDVFTDRHVLYLKNGQRPPWYSTSRSQEAKGLNRADIVVAIQDVERSILQNISRRPVVTIGHSVELAHLEGSDLSSNILYLGSKNPINLQSINHFISEVMPEVNKVIPGATLKVAGSVCDDLKTSDKFIEKLGRVSDLRSAYTSADVVINPMLYGTGLKVKNVEALGFSKPLITTSVGAEGLEAGVGKAFLVANSKEEWLDRLVCLLGDPEQRKVMARHAYEFAQSWNADILNSLSDVVGSRVSPTSSSQVH